MTGNVLEENKKSLFFWQHCGHGRKVKICWILAALIFWYSLHQPLNLQNCYSICNHIPFFQYEIILQFRLLKWQCLFEDHVEDPVSSGNFSSVCSEGEESLSKEIFQLLVPGWTEYFHMDQPPVPPLCWFCSIKFFWRDRAGVTRQSIKYKKRNFFFQGSYIGTLRAERLRLNCEHWSDISLFPLISV